jgi:hypothetical protein
MIWVLDLVLTDDENVVGDMVYSSRFSGFLTRRSVKTNAGATAAVAMRKGD